MKNFTPTVPRVIMPQIGLKSRGLVGAPRADATPKPASDTPEDVYRQLMAAVTEFKEHFTNKLDKDVVSAEKGQRLENAVDDLTKQLNAVNQVVARLTIGGDGGVAPLSNDVLNHAKAFESYFRKGAENGLGDLQVKAALTSQENESGGYLVPAEMDTTIMRVAEKMSVFRQLADVMPVSSDRYEAFVNMGGAGGGWVGEEETRSETGTPTLREIAWNLMELYAFPFTTQKMLDMGIIDIAAWLADEVAIKFAEMEAEAFALGNGHKKPIGLFRTDHMVANASYAWGKFGFVTTGVEGAFQPTAPTADPATNPTDVFIDVYGALKQKYRANASWLMNDLTMTPVRKFRDADGNLIWAPPSAARDVETILGKPVYTDDFCPLLAANSFPIAFGDFKQAYRIITFPGTRVLRDDLTVKGKVGFYTTAYVGGGPKNYEAVKFIRAAA